MSRTEEKRRNFIGGVAIVTLTVVLVCIGLCIKHAARIEVQSDEAEEVPTVYIVYTDDVGAPYAVQSEPEEFSFTYLRERLLTTTELSTYTRVYYPLTMDEREWLAEILAGKAADRTEACQRMVATVIFNDIMDCGCDLNQAMQEYDLGDLGTPTAQIYGVIDAVFYCGEFMLDPEVLWCNDKDHPSAFHDSLVYECECDGMVFYRAHRPAVVPGGVEG